jgi:hypothetical protein
VVRLLARPRAAAAGVHAPAAAGRRPACWARAATQTAVQTADLVLALRCRGWSLQLLGRRLVGRRACLPSPPAGRGTHNPLQVVTHTMTRSSGLCVACAPAWERIPPPARWAPPRCSPAHPAALDAACCAWW